MAYSASVGYGCRARAAILKNVKFACLGTAFSTYLAVYGRINSGVFIRAYYAITVSFIGVYDFNAVGIQYLCDVVTVIVGVGAAFSVGFLDANKITVFIEELYTTELWVTDLGEQTVSVR